MIVLYTVLSIVLAAVLLAFIVSFNIFRKTRRAAIASLMAEGAHLNLDKESFEQLVRAATQLALTEMRAPHKQEILKQADHYKEALALVSMYYLFQQCRKGEHPNELLCKMADGTNNLRRFNVYVKMVGVN